MTDIVRPPAILEHDLNQHFSELLKFESTAQMEASDLWKQIRPEVERIMNAVVVESSSVLRAVATGDKISALAWNLERGIRLDGIIDALKTNDDLTDKDILLLAELDQGMARSGNRFVAQEIADALKMNYAFAPVYIALQKGSGVEAAAEGENTASIHGIAMMSPWPIQNAHAVPLPNGKDKMSGKEKRLGWLRALIADIEHPSGTFRAVAVHLDVHCSREHRRRQMRIILDRLDTLPPLPTLIGGDWNTTTFNAQTATHAILGFWRRVMMGVKNVVKNHFPHPDRGFERGLFRDVETHGYEYRSLNELGVGTLHYDMESIGQNTNLRDWMPEWCFKFIFWAAGRVGGRVSVRLDWFAGKGIEVAPNTSPRTIANLVDKGGVPLSDHDAIVVDCQIKK
jgi:endonuclease/exonuclease/phosphatase family metal-dependent hydrolase